MALEAPQFIFITFSFGSGGAEKQMLWMARTLVSRGMRCELIELKWNVGNQRLARLIEATKLAGAKFSYSRPDETYLGAWCRVRRIVRAHPRAILWSWGHKSDLFALTCGHWDGSRPWVSSLRSAAKHRLERSAAVMRFCRRWVTRYVSNTWLNCEQLEAVCPGVRGRCRVVYNVVEELATPAIDLPKVVMQPLRLMMLGNIAVHTKGYDYTLDLAERFRREGVPVELHIAGRPDSGEWLPRQIARRALTSTVFFHGETGDPQAFLRSGHAFLLMSRFEGMPNALLEAMSIGLPAVSTKVGDLPRIACDGHELRLIDVGDLAAAQRAIMAMLQDWPAAVAMGQRGREWCQKHFNEEHCTQSLMETVNEVFEGLP